MPGLGEGEEGITSSFYKNKAPGGAFLWYKLFISRGMSSGSLMAKGLVHITVVSFVISSPGFGYCGLGFISPVAVCTCLGDSGKTWLTPDYW